MEIVFHAARHTWRWSLRLTWLALLCLLLLTMMAWMLLPQARYLQDDLAASLGEYLQAPVAIAGLSGRWEGIYPSVEIRGFTLLHPDSAEALFQFHRAEAVLDLPASLWQRRLVLRELVLRGGQLSLLHGSDGWHLLPGEGMAQRDQQLDFKLLGDLLARLQTLSLELDSLQLITETSRQTLEFSNLRLDLRVSETQRELDLLITPPASQQPINPARLRIVTTPENPEQFDFFLRARQMSLEPYQQLISPLSGLVDVGIRGNWDNRGLAHLEGLIQLYSPRLSSVSQPTSNRLVLGSLARIDTHLNWRRHPSGWRGESRFTGLDKSDQQRWESQLSLQRPTDDGPLEGEFEHLPVALMISLARPWLGADLANQLAQLQPGGHLRNTRFSLGPELDSIQLYSHFKDLSTRPWGKIPGIDGLDGTLRWTPQGGGLSLRSHFLRIHGQPLAAPVELALDGAVDWNHQPQATAITLRALRLENADLSATLNGNVDLTDEDPFLDLRLAVAHLNLERIPRYLPVILMKPQLVFWLRQALVGGQVRDGRGALQGHLKDFPFDGSSDGWLELSLPVEQLTLDYAPPWPALREAQGELQIRNRSLAISVTGGQILDATLEHASARIETLGEPPMTITATTRGAAQTYLAAVQQGKAPEEIKQQLARLDINGNPQVSVDVLLPFRKRKPVVSGRVDFSGSTVMLNQYRLRLDDLHGGLDFSQDGLQATALRLKLHDRPATLDIRSEAIADGKRLTHFNLSGEPDPAQLLDLLGNYISGRSPWQAQISARDAGHYRVQLQSNLIGTRLQLPQPLGKSAGTPRELKVDATVSPETLEISLDMAPGLSGQLRWSKRPQLQLQRGELRLNTGQARMPEEPGLALIARLEKWAPMESMAGNSALSTTLPPWFRLLDVQLETLQLGNLQLPELHLRLQRASATQLRGNIEGHTAAGELDIPLDGQTPLRANLRWLRLPRPEDTSSASPGTVDNLSPDINPHDIPPLDLSIDNLEIAGQSWGTLQIQTRRLATGLELDPLVVGNQQQRLAGRGDWRLTPAGQLSRLQLNLQSQALGDSLMKLGLDPQISGAPASALLELSWNGPLWRPRLADLGGILDVDIGSGQFLSLEPGSLGRLLGLMSLQGLGRRLSLDFSDVNDQGTGFDSIRGSITLEHGVARINDLTLLSPAAQVYLQGTLGLLDHTLDQTAWVVPRIGTSLGIASTLVAGPMVGAAVLAADTLLPGGVGQAASLGYQIRGSWQQPDIQRISTLPPQRRNDPLNSITNR